MNKLTAFLLAAAASCCWLYAGGKVVLEGAALKREMLISQPGALLQLDDGVGFKTAPQNKSAFFQHSLQWQTANIKQLVITARFDRPGRVRFSCRTARPDGTHKSTNIYTTVIPDGAYHDYIFNVGSAPYWQGVMTNYELRFFGPEDSEFVLKKLAADDKQTFQYVGPDLRGKVHTFRAKTLPSNDGLRIQLTGDFGGFHQQKLNWKADEINTVSFKLKSSHPGTLRYACSLQSEDGRRKHSMALPVQKIPGDDQYHWYRFKLDTHPLFQGIQSNYELRYTGEEYAVLELQQMTAEKTPPAARKLDIPNTLSSYEIQTSSSAGTDGIVKCGEKVTLKAQALKDGKVITDKNLYLQVRCFADGEGSKIVNAPIDREFVWSVTMKQPGRAYIECAIKSHKNPASRIFVSNPRNSRHKLASHGIGILAAPEQQRIRRPEPADFDKFWAARKTELAQVPLKVVKKVPYKTDLPRQNRFEIYDMQISCAGPAPVSGIITIPKDKSRKYPAVVTYHGAGVRSANPVLWDGAIVFDVNAHGLPNGRSDAFYQAIPSPYKQSAEKRFEMFQYMFLRALRALEYVRTLPEWNQKDLIVSGGSQGGVQSIAAAALDKSVTLAAPSIPAMIGVAEFTLRKNVEPAWPNPYVKEFNAKQDISAIARKFDYVDGAFLLRRVNCPIYVSIGLYDVIAAHVFAAFNECPARDKTIICVPDMGHYNYNPAGRKAISEIIKKQQK